MTRRRGRPVGPRTGTDPTRALSLTSYGHRRGFDYRNPPTASTEHHEPMTVTTDTGDVEKCRWCYQAWPCTTVADQPEPTE